MTSTGCRCICILPVDLTCSLWIIPKISRKQPIHWSTFISQNIGIFQIWFQIWKLHLNQGYSPRTRIVIWIISTYLYLALILTLNLTLTLTETLTLTQFVIWYTFLSILWKSFKGIARTQSPTNKNCAPESPTFGVIAVVSPTGVQWKGLELEEPPSGSRCLLCQVSMLGMASPWQLNPASAPNGNETYPDPKSQQPKIHHNKKTFM